MCAYRHVVSVPCPMASANLFFVMSSLLGSSNPKDRDGVFSPLVTPLTLGHVLCLRSLFTFATELEGRLESANS